MQTVGFTQNQGEGLIKGFNSFEVLSLLTNGSVDGWIMPRFPNLGPPKGVSAWIDWYFFGQFSNFSKNGHLQGDDLVYVPIQFQQEKLFHFFVVKLPDELLHDLQEVDFPYQSSEHSESSLGRIDDNLKQTLKTKKSKLKSTNRKKIEFLEKKIDQILKLKIGTIGIHLKDFKIESLENRQQLLQVPHFR